MIVTAVVMVMIVVVAVAVAAAVVAMKVAVVGMTLESHQESGVGSMEEV